MADNIPARQSNIAREHGTIFAVQDGDLHVHQRIGTHLIDELSFEAVPPTAGEQPSRLLNAGNRVVRFTGRARELAQLTAWRDDAAAVAVRLVHGGAGHGKSRLADRFAELSRMAGWTTLRARHNREVAVRPVEVWAGNTPAVPSRTIVVVDYAERWPLSDLLALLLDRRLYGSGALRVLLLARPLGNWWHALTHRLFDAIGVDADSQELGVLGATPSDSREAFEVARACFAAALGVSEPDDPAPDLRGSILTIHMAALAYVLAVRHGDTLPADPGHLSAYLLSRERSHWQSMFDNDRRIASTPQVMGRAVYVAALTRSLDYGAAVAVLKSATVADSVDSAARVLDDHAMCYPPQDAATVLEPLYPDRLAEDFVALQTPGHRIDRFRADPWAADALGALLDHGPQGASTVLPLLVEAARRWSHLADGQLLPLLRERPELAVRAGSPALSALAAFPAVPLDVLAAIESALPNDPPADLYAGIAAITERLAAGLAGPAEDPARAVALYLKLGRRLLNSGRITDGIELLARAVAAGRRLAAREPAQLELALRTLGRAHVGATNWAEATAMLSEAVDLWSAHGARVTPPADEVAGCLADLSLALWHQGQAEWSLEIRHRAIARLRRLVETEPRHRGALIRALVQQAEQLRRGDRPQDSLRALDEAVDLLRAVAGAGNAGLEVEFAAALLGQARTLRLLGDLAEAEHAVSGAVTVFRQLAAVNVLYDRDLAQALGLEAAILAGLERWPAAVTAHDRVIAIHRRLYRLNTDRYGLDLVQALIAFARLCRDAGLRTEDALAALAQAIGVLQAGRYDGAVQARLLDSAHSIGADLLDASGRPAEADLLRQRSAPRPSGARSTPDPRPSQAPMRSGLDHREEARAVAGVAPYLARTRLERHPAQDIALVLLAMTPRYAWLELMFRGFRPDKALAILRRLVRDDALIREGVTLRFVAKQLLDCPRDAAADILGHANPVTAAAILNHDEWVKKARLVLSLLAPDHAARITRLLPYDPEKPRPRYRDQTE